MTTSRPSTPSRSNSRTVRSMSARLRAGRRDHHVGDVAERRADVARVARLALGDAREHLVVELLHDAQQADPRAGGPGARRGPVSAGRRRSGSGHRARRSPLGRAGQGCPSVRARWTVRATSSHMTAALTASRAVGADGEHAVAAHQHRGRAVSASVATMPWPISSPPMSANGPTGIAPPNSSAIAVRTHGIGSAARRPGGRVRAVRVGDAAHGGHLAVDVGVREACRWRARGRPRRPCRGGRRRPSPPG